ncbi:hypothetical protein Barb6_00024 [Bacteroidales bacterium Barb6]|nr:hypothetical protein Barb6XT_02357 [Bacteroidales bacterium Barb6XT]OAV67764.1 hypothetical protein Barb4_02336 [Bacteroidales bacterium Barb4]OAV73646.1 hypothetical protein Barb6_00024 [Bacteroidales bacterium Barb6]
MKTLQKWLFLMAVFFTLASCNNDIPQPIEESDAGFQKPELPYYPGIPPEDGDSLPHLFDSKDFFVEAPEGSKLSFEVRFYNTEKGDEIWTPTVATNDAIEISHKIMDLGRPVNDGRFQLKFLKKEASKAIEFANKIYEATDEGMGGVYVQVDDRGNDTLVFIYYRFDVEVSWGWGYVK